MTKLQYLISVLPKPVMDRVSARLGRPATRPKRFTPPMSAGYWALKRAARNGGKEVDPRLHIEHVKDHSHA